MKQTQMAKAVAAMTLGGALLMAGASAFAADTADLTVKGNIVPGACTPSFEGGGEVDFGTLRAEDLKADDFTKLDAKTLKLTVSCPTKKYVKFSVVDNQKASSLGTAVTSTLGAASGDVYVFGLGSTAIDGKSVSLGSYGLSVDTLPTVDGNPAASLAYANTDGNILGIWNTSAKWMKGDGSEQYTAGTSGLFNLAGSLPGKVFVFPVTVTAALNKGSLLPINEDVKLNGQATFQLVYQ
jgi:type 1 fimbria pilin